MAGSAGALPIILAQLDRLTFRSDAALFVIYHRLPNAQFHLEDFAPRCIARIQAAEDGAPVEPNRVYYPRENQDLLVKDGKLRTGTQSAARHHPNIDVLMESLAAGYGPRVVAALLSGMATDGLKGLRAVRDRGGRTLVQDPLGAKFPQLPAAAVAAGLADDVLAMPDLHGEIERVLRPGGRLAARIAH